jgi:hypothetical protein
LPSLAHLVLWARYVPDEGVLFSSSATIRSLDYFESSRPGIAFHFQAGAVPKVETLRFQLRVRGMKACGIPACRRWASDESEKSSHRFGLLWEQKRRVRCTNDRGCNKGLL